jgi:hypothetical protein
VTANGTRSVGEGIKEGSAIVFGSGAFRIRIGRCCVDVVAH